MDNHFLELALHRRSVRKYTDEPIPDAVIEEILQAALTAPSSMNRLPMEYIVVRDKTMLEQIAATRTMGATPLLGADAAIASTYILLAAEALGIGACWIHVRGSKSPHGATEEVRALLGVPDDYRVINMIALGHKAEERPPYEVDQLPMAKIHHEKF